MIALYQKANRNSRFKWQWMTKLSMMPRCFTVIATSPNLWTFARRRTRRLSFFVSNGRDLPSSTSSHRFWSMIPNDVSTFPISCHIQAFQCCAPRSSSCGLMEYPCWHNQFLHWFNATILFIDTFLKPQPWRDRHRLQHWTTRLMSNLETNRVMKKAFWYHRWCWLTLMMKTAEETGY